MELKFRVFTVHSFLPLQKFFAILVLFALLALTMAEPARHGGFGHGGGSKHHGGGGFRSGHHGGRSFGGGSFGGHKRSGGFGGKHHG